MPPGIGYPSVFGIPQMDNRMGMGGSYGFAPAPMQRPPGFGMGGPSRLPAFNGGGRGVPDMAQRPGVMPTGMRELANRIRGRFPSTPGAPLPGGQPGGPPGAQPPGNRGVPSFEELIRLMQSGAIDVNEMNQLVRAAIGGRTAEGTIFDPRGTAASQEARRAESGRISNALQRRNKLMQASRPGLDPSQRGFADFWSDIGIQGGLARSGQDYYNQQAQGYDDFLRSLLGGQLGYGFDLGRAEVDRRNQQSMQPPSGGGVSIGPIGFQW